MPDVPRHDPRTPLPNVEPVWTTPHPDDDEPWVQYAGGLHIGEYKNLDDVRYRKHTPLKHFHPGPLGFLPNDTTQEVNQDGE